MEYFQFRMKRCHLAVQGGGLGDGCFELELCSATSDSRSSFALAFHACTLQYDVCLFLRRTLGLHPVDQLYDERIFAIARTLRGATLTNNFIF